MNLNNRNDLSAFFEPEAVAVFGSMREVVGTAYWIIKNMRHFGYPGKVYPVNPKPLEYGEVFGYKVVSGLNDIDGPVDLAIVLTPPKTVPDIVSQCAGKGVKAVIILSEGFAEAHEEGVNIQRQVSDISHQTGIRVMGPNTFGVVNTANGLVTVPPYIDNDTIEKGGIAFCSQTGSIGPHQMPLKDWGCPISIMCDIGNKCDVDESDVLSYLAFDPETKVVAMHLEDVKSGERFMKAARQLTEQKPLVILKTGRSEAGAKASASHTGSLLGRDQIYDAAFKQAGVIRVNTWRELWEVPRTLVYQPLPKGNRFACITFTGGQGVIAVDAAAEAGLSIAKFSPETIRKLYKIFPRLGGNPVDVGPAMSDSRSQSSANPFSVIEEAASAVTVDENVDCFTISFYVGQHMIPAFPMFLDMFQRIKETSTKTMNIWIYGTNLQAMEDFSRKLQQREIPAYFDLDIAVKALGYAAYYSMNKTGLNSESTYHYRSA